MNILNNPYIQFVIAGLFSSEEEWIHPARTETTYELIYVINGTVHLEETGTEYTLTPGQLILLKPGIMHSGFLPSSNVSFYWVHFHADTAQFPIAGGYFPKFDSAYLFRELLHYCHLPCCPECQTNSILIRILSEMFFIQRSKSAPADKTAEEIYEWLRINADARLTVAAAAAHFNFSPDHLSRLLFKRFGAGTKSIINKFLLMRAKNLLSNTGKYVKEIAFELGFENDKAFIEYFRYHEGNYPRNYRNKYFKTHMNKK